MSPITAAARTRIPNPVITSLAACRPGAFIHNGQLGFKSEYGAVAGKDLGGGKVEFTVTSNPDAYCLDSGEHFWGGAPNREALNALHVEPVDLEATIKRVMDEVTFWRQDATARLRTALALAKAAEAEGDERRAADLRVGVLMPTRAALASARAGDLYWPLCEGCSKPVEEGDAVFLYEDLVVAHVDCDQPAMADLPEHAIRHQEDEDYSPAGIAKTLADVRAYLDAPEEA